MKLTKSQLSLLVKQLIREADGDDDLLTPDDEKRLATRSIDVQAERDKLIDIFRERAVDGEKIEIIDIRKKYKNKEPFMSSVIKDGEVYTDVLRGEKALDYWGESGSDGTTLISDVVFGLGGPKIIGSVFAADKASLTSANDGIETKLGANVNLEKIFKNVIKNFTESGVIQVPDDSLAKKASVKGYINQNGTVRDILIVLRAFDSAAYGPVSGSRMRIKITKSDSFNESSALQRLKTAGMYKGQPPPPPAPTPPAPSPKKKPKATKKSPRGKLEEADDKDVIDVYGPDEAELKNRLEPGSPKDEAISALKSENLSRGLLISVEMVESLDTVIRHLADLIMSKHYAVRVGGRTRRPA
jgi:hypothetical protein